KPETRNEMILLVYVLITSAHLAIFIHEREPRFFYHIVPFLIVLSTVSIFRFFCWFCGDIVRPRWISLAFASVLVIFCLGQIDSDLRMQASASADPASINIKFGNDIARLYPSDTKILADAYTYLPPSMINVTYTNLQTEELIKRVAPK